MAEQPFMSDRPFDDRSSEGARPFDGDRPAEGEGPFDGARPAAGDLSFMHEQPSDSHQPFMGEPPVNSYQPFIGQSGLWDDAPPPWEQDLDALLRPSFIVAPPPDAQQAILAAVLQAAAQTPISMPATQPIPVENVSRPVPLIAYVLLAAVLVAYAAALSWAQSIVDAGTWLPTLTAQIVAASESVLGPLPLNEPLTLTWVILQRAPWLALLPLAALLWERDRASSAQAA